MLLNKRRTPFGLRANITKKLLSVERNGASCQYARTFCKLDRQTPMFLPYDLREWSGTVSGVERSGP